MLLNTKFIARLLVCTLVSAVFTACSEKTPVFQSIDLTGAGYAQDFALPDHTGRLRRLKDFAGKVVVVFFGYTQCPDVCPTTLMELTQVKKILDANGQQGHRLQVVFISVDPERDMPEVLNAYMSNFDPSFIALRPRPEQLPEVAKSFRIYFKKVQGSTPGSYSMDHSAGSYVFDPQGRLRLYHRYGGSAKGLASDIEQLLKPRKS